MWHNDEALSSSSMGDVLGYDTISLASLGFQPKYRPWLELTDLPMVRV